MTTMWPEEKRRGKRDFGTWNAGEFKVPFWARLCMDGEAWLSWPGGDPDKLSSFARPQVGSC